jgi:hypothetical protein
MCGLLILSLTSLAKGQEFSGTTKLGWVFVDEEGSAAVNQPTFNLYDGLALSLERFSFKFDNGLKIYGDFKNVTLNNRNLKLGLTKPRKYGLTFNNNQYRRFYSDDGSDYTRRRFYNGQVWLEPVDGFRVFGGLGLMLKKGTNRELFEPVGFTARHEVDYTQTTGNVGFRFTRDRRYFKTEYRLSKYTDEFNSNSDRLTSRLRFTGSAPVPTRDDLFLSAGFQHYSAEMEVRQDTLTTNAFWGGAQWYGYNHYSVKYSFLFDRSRRTGDISATDNILHALYLTRSWVGQGGFTIGYRRQTTDDVYDEVSQNGYFTSAWYKPMTKLTLKAGYGNEQSSVNAGRTLEGEKSRTKFWTALKYRRDEGGWDLMFKNRSTENNEFAGWDQSSTVNYPRGISYSTEYMEIANDIYYENKSVGTLRAAYSYVDGDYTNDSGKFAYLEHVLSGDFESILVSQFTFQLGATYLRGKEDLDYERTVVRMGVNWAFRPGHKLEVKYSAHNFDDYIDPSPVYTAYYTANVVRVNLIREL